MLVLVIGGFERELLEKGLLSSYANKIDRKLTTIATIWEVGPGVAPKGLVYAPCHPTGKQ